MEAAGGFDFFMYGIPGLIIAALVTGLLHPSTVSKRAQKEVESLSDDLRRTREELLLNRGRLHDSLRSLPASSSTSPDTFVIKNARGDVCVKYTSPMPGEPTMCLLNHRHSYSCPGMIPEVRERVNPYVPFDPDFAEIGVIEPIFVMDDQLKWKNAQ